MSSINNTTDTTTTGTAATSGGASAGQKVKGAFQAAFGIGESIRGNAMDFVDSAFGTERKEHGATVAGQQQTATGVANMEGHYPAGTAPVDATAAATHTSTAAPAVPPTGASELRQPPPVHPGSNY